MQGCCQNCSMEIYGEDLGDFAGMMAPALVAEGYGLVADCEFCGQVLVDGNGRRVALTTCDA